MPQQNPADVSMVATLGSQTKRVRAISIAQATSRAAWAFANGDKTRIKNVREHMEQGPFTLVPEYPDQVEKSILRKVDEIRNTFLFAREGGLSMVGATARIQHLYADIDRLESLAKGVTKTTHTTV